jgi:hypothetical protein
MRTCLGLLLLLLTVSVYADGMLYRVPEDGAWARYATKVTVTQKNEPKVTEVGTMTLASVGQEVVGNAKCRWLEIVVDTKPPGAGPGFKSVFKALIPERRLGKGRDPLVHWIKGWGKVGPQPAQPLPRELLTNPAMMLNLFVSGPLRSCRGLDSKTIETPLGTLMCAGESGTRVLKGAAVNVKNGKTTSGDIQVRIENYFHEAAPFGVVASRQQVEFPDFGDGKTTAETVFTLLAAGTGATSELPDQK